MLIVIVNVILMPYIVLQRRLINIGKIDFSSMKKLFVFVIALFLATYTVDASQGKYRVFLRDKGPEQFVSGTEIYQRTLAAHTQRCLDRRAKLLHAGDLLTIEDAPLYRPYLDSLEDIGAEIILELRWLNYAVVSCDSVVATETATFDFVSGVQPTSSKLTENSIQYPNKISPRHNSILTETYTDSLYGGSLAQNELINIVKLHSSGINGKGVLIGVIDSGFDYEINKSFSHVDIVGTRDFIFGDEDVIDREEDSLEQRDHGTVTFSTIAGYYPGRLFGAAPAASFLLAKTEDLRSETRIEEDYYAAAIEWMEALGADISTSSVGYRSFDTTQTRYSFPDLDGNSTIAARIVNIASKKGMLCFTSAGNNGPEESSILTPGDADSIVTIGSVGIDTASNIFVPNYSARGPNAAGNIKPDFSFLGNDVVCAGMQAPETILKINGTSMAAPQAAGAAALMLQAFPEITAPEIKQYLRKNSTRSDDPNNIVGYGIPDFFRAMKDYGIIISPPIVYSIGKYRRIAVYVYSINPLNTVKMNIGESAGANSREIFMNLNSGNLFTADLDPDEFSQDSLLCYFTADDHFYERRNPYDESDYFTINLNRSTFPLGIIEESLPHHSEEANEAFIHPSVVHSEDYFIKLNFKAKPGDAQIYIYDLYGKNIYSKMVKISYAGYVQWVIPVSRISSGAYFVMVRTDDIFYRLKFLISR